MTTSPNPIRLTARRALAAAAVLLGSLALFAAPADASPRSTDTAGVVSVVVIPQGSYTVADPPDAVPFACDDNTCTCDTFADCAALIVSGKCTGTLDRNGTCTTD